MKKIFLSTCILISALLQGLAQTIPFTQYYNTPALLNSSLTGLNAGARVQAINRSHWVSTNENYATLGALAELNFKDGNHSGGLAFFALNEGLGKGPFGSGSLEKTTGGVSFAYHSMISKTKSATRYLSGGLSARLVQTSVVWDDYIFSDQIHPIFGSHIDKNTQAFPPEPSYSNPALSVGANYIQKNFITNFWDIARNDYFEIGASYSSLITVRNSIYDYEVFERKRLTLHFRSELLFNEHFEPNNRVGLTGRFERIRGNGSEMALNGYVINWNVVFGMGFQSTLASKTLGDAGQDVHRLNITGGYVMNGKLKKYKNLLYISYNYSGAINAISNARLGNNHEISLIIQFTQGGFRHSEGIRPDGFF